MPAKGDKNKYFDRMSGYYEPYIKNILYMYASNCSLLITS